MTEPALLVKQLRETARNASSRAHSPYSGFQVGAVVVGADGETWSGCNVESVSYGLTQCAERNALATAIGQGAAPGSLQHMLVYTRGERALPPCGACRQLMLELMDEGGLIVACCDTDQWIAWQVGELMPTPFLPR